MLNLHLGEQGETGGCSVIVTREGASGHAVYGPYDRLDPGRYEVEFSIRLATGERPPRDVVVAVVDVAADQGARQLACDFVFLSRIGTEPTRIVLPFDVADASEVEYRVHVSGGAALAVADRPVVRRRDGGGDGQLGGTRLAPRHRDTLKSLYDRGAVLERRDGALVMTLDGVTFAAGCYDDVNFIDELFFKSAYNFRTTRDTCVIDVGMNVGLASLLFARQESVREVHAFEPFAETFARGRANIALNPALAPKIATHHFGLAGADEESVFFVPNTNGDSGGQSARNVEGGIPVRLRLRHATAVLGPIIASAKARGLQVIAKIDCEGAEFDIVATLAAAGLLDAIALLMVEWHRIYDGRTQEELIRPLLDRGFTAIDLTPPTGNGFFYAARIAGA